MEELHVVSFSGGKDSTAMLLYMLDKGMRVDKIIKVDTTKEFPEMYDHIRKVESYIGRKIETVKIDFDYWFGEHVKTKGKLKGSKGYGWPDFRNRWCTALKREAASFLIAGQGYDPRKRGIAVVEYHGIAVDEQIRASKNSGRRIVYPLIEAGMTERDCLQFCYDRGFDWGGLYERRIRVSCFCCPLQRINEVRDVYLNCPDLWSKMKEMDGKSFRKFRSDYSLQELEEKFKKGK